MVTAEVTERQGRRQRDPFGAEVESLMMNRHDEMSAGFIGVGDSATLCGSIEEPQGVDPDPLSLY
jgi:hypothetical protein